MSPENEEDRLDQNLRDLRASGGDFPVREETLDSVWQRTPAARSSATFRARIYALLDDGAVESDRRRCGATIAQWRTAARLQPGDLASRLQVRSDELAGLEAGRVHPAIYDAAFWRGFADAVGLSRPELATFLKSTAALIAGSFAAQRSTTWATDLELPTDAAEAEAVLRARLDQIIAALALP